MREASPYVGLGVQHDFIDAHAVTIGGTIVSDNLPNTTLDASIGFASIVADFELHLDARYQQATDGEKDGVRANLGFRKRF